MLVAPWILHFIHPPGIFPPMPGKEKIVEELGDLLLPNLVNSGLVANDRAKYLMTLLQASREHADHPDAGFMNLKQERTDCGIKESAFDSLVQQSGKVGDGTYRIPGIGGVHAALVQNVRVMLAPIEAAVATYDGDPRRAPE